MKHWKIWTAFAAVFLAGAMVGVTGVGLVIKHHFGAKPDQAEFHRILQERITRDIQKELGLTEAETMPIRTEVGDTLDQLRQLHEQGRPKVKTIVTDGLQRLKSHLTPEQRARLDEMIRKHREPRFNLFLPPPPPPPFP